MIDLPFDPEVTLPGGIVLAWHAIFATLGFLIPTLLVARIARSHVPPSRVYWMGSWMIPSGFVVARLVHVAEHWRRYLADPLAIFAVWDGGLGVMGAVIGGGLAMAVTARLARVPLGFFADVIGLVSPLGMAIGRVGDVINGEHHAAGCEGLPWCVRYTHPNTLGQGPHHPPPEGYEYVHPAVAYELLMDLAIAGLILRLRPRLVGRVPEGRLLWLFIGLYGLGRFFLSFLRLDPTVALGLRHAQFVSIGFVVAAAVALAYLTARRKQTLARS